MTLTSNKIELVVRIIQDSAELGGIDIYAIPEENVNSIIQNGLKKASIEVSEDDYQRIKKEFEYKCHIHQKEGVVLELNESEISQLYGIEELSLNNSGTLVLWEDFDALEKSSGDIYTALNDYKIKIIGYLSLIFHRYLNDETEKRLHISVNSLKLKGLEPFLEKHKKTNIRQEFKLAIKDTKGIERYVSVTPFVLPYQKDLTKVDLDFLGGIENLRTKQGFYIYRNHRLIILGNLS